ncbi:MAG: L-threonylcarbamoyladenylate synthase [Candidatus Thermoplasmatota archaeon]
MRRLTTPDPHGIQAAALALHEGRLVVFPTETVYGVGADCGNAAAVRAIFAAKGRPADNPVIVHVADVRMAQALAADWPDDASKLAKAFWPGPLTLVVRRNGKVPDVVSGGLDTVAVRVPDHPVALALLKACGFGVAAPSANKSGRPSPTRCTDARDDLGDAVAVYLDGGPTRVGVESTVVDLTGKRPALLRPGGVPREAIEAVVGPLAAAPSSAKPLGPGMKYRHYAPATPLLLLDSADLKQAYADAAAQDKAWLVSSDLGVTGPNVHVVGGRGDPEAWARQLFALLRDVDKEGHSAIVVEAIPETGLGAAVMNRLRKAAEGGQVP